MADVVESRSSTIPAPAEEVWRVLSAFDRIGDWFPDVDHASYLTDGQAGVGTARRVQMGRTVLVERITEWDPPHALAYDLEGLPPVVGGATNRWTLAEDGDRTRVTLTSTVDPGFRPPGRVVARLLARRLAKADEAMLTGLAEHLRGGSP